MGKLGILAGGGRAPHQLVKTCRDMGRSFFVFGLESHVDEDLATDAIIPLGKTQIFKDICARENITEIIMLGRVRRPSVAELQPDLLGLKLLAKIGLNMFGDDGLLRALSDGIEKECQVKVISAADVFKDFLTPEGILTKAAPDAQAQEDITRAIEIAQTLGKLDIGQAVIVQQGIVLGVEAIEGTDELIARAGMLKRQGAGGVLVKLAKPQQDNRFDLPAIGPDTIQGAKKAGLVGIALEAERSLIIDKQATLEKADKAGLFVIGLKL